MSANLVIHWAAGPPDVITAIRTCSPGPPVRWALPVGPSLQQMPDAEESQHAVEVSSAMTPVTPQKNVESARAGFCSAALFSVGGGVDPEPGSVTT